MNPRPSPAKLLAALLLFLLLHTAHATPISASLARRDTILTYDNAGHIQNVTDAATGIPIDQGAATDGSGSGFNVPAIIWLALSFAVGVPLLGGIRLWRAASGAGVGVVATVCVWTAFVNAMDSDGISDETLTLIALGAFVCGFVIGCFNFSRLPGIACLSILGGVSIGVRVVLFRPGLLIHATSVNWAVIAAPGLMGFVLVFLRQKAALIIGSSATGTFLTILGIDLIENRQRGMSLGLRYLFDHNTAHIEYLESLGWNPPLLTQILMGVSLAVIPLFVFGQYLLSQRMFVCTHPSISTQASDDSTHDESDPALAEPLVASSSEKSVGQGGSHNIALPPLSPSSAGFDGDARDSQSSAGKESKKAGYAV